MRYTPMRCTPVRCTPVRYTLVRCTPMRCTPMRYMPMRCTPVRYMPMRCTPVRYTPMRCTPMRCTPVTCTPVRYTPMRHPPTIALVALWPKQWLIYRDLSFKIRVFALVAGSLSAARLQQPCTPERTWSWRPAKHFLHPEYSIFTNQQPNMSRRLSLIPYVESPDIANIRTYLDEGAVSSLLS